MKDPAQELPVHAMTCDVEDYFQVSAFEGIIDRKQWSHLECRIAGNIDRILSMFDVTGARGTFFILGWVAENLPDVVRRIAAEGHEIASHGMEHRRVWQQTPKQFLEDARTSRQILEETAGVPVAGYRAASWSFDQRTPWAHEMLSKAGYLYSSSIYPVKHDHYGAPNAPARPHTVCGSGILEIPASVVRIGGRNVPASGGGFFRLFPLALSEWLINRAESVNTSPYIFYFHPWEIDVDQPRVTGLTPRIRFRHYVNISKVESRLRVLLDRFRWGRMDEIFLPSTTT